MKPSTIPKHLGRHPLLHRQRGVLLIITLIMLVVISGVAALSIKGSGSSEAIANNARTQGLAIQAAEAALRYCEIGAINQNLVDRSEPLSKNPTQGFPSLRFAIRPAPAAVVGSVPLQFQAADWQSLSAWQGNTGTYIATPVTRASLDALGGASSSGAALAGTFASVYKRNPDCIVQYAENTGNAILTVVARGFGPEVANADGNPGEIPHGSEVFLQATVKLPP